MSVEKVSRLSAQLEELRRERNTLISEIRERQSKITEIDEVIRRFLKLKVEALKTERQKCSPSTKKKK